jgi:hypothetical protein
MSDNQNPIVEEVTEATVVEAPVETSVEVHAEATLTDTQTAAPTSDKPARSERPEQKGDRPRGPRRDGMREEEKEFKEEMLSIDRVTRVTA